MTRRHIILHNQCRGMQTTLIETRLIAMMGTIAFRVSYFTGFLSRSSRDWMSDEVQYMLPCVGVKVQCMALQ
jgi:hypothetical protein